MGPLGGHIAGQARSYKGKLEPCGSGLAPRRAAKQPCFNPVRTRVMTRYFSASSRNPFSVLNGASTTNLLATNDGTLPPGSVCTW